MRSAVKHDNGEIGQDGLMLVKGGAKRRKVEGEVAQQAEDLEKEDMRISNERKTDQPADKPRRGRGQGRGRGRGAKAKAASGASSSRKKAVDPKEEGKEDPKIADGRNEEHTERDRESTVEKKEEVEKKEVEKKEEVEKDKGNKRSSGSKEPVETKRGRKTGGGEVNPFDLPPDSDQKKLSFPKAVPAGKQEGKDDEKKEEKKDEKEANEKKEPKDLCAIAPILYILSHDTILLIRSGCCTCR